MEVAAPAAADSSLLRALVDALPAMVAYWDVHQRCRFANRAYEAWFGIKPEMLMGRHMRDLLGPIYPVVDDDVRLSNTIARVLGNDHDVTVVNDGREAIALLSDSALAYDVVVCDLMMPEVTGAEVFAAVTEKHPELAERFIIVTGGAFTPRGRRFIDSVSVPVIEKPFKISNLRSAIVERAQRAGKRRERSTS